MAASPFGRFTVLDELGAGGMGRVFRAHDPTLRREVCIKVLRDEAEGPAANLLAEARAAAALTHPNICTVYDVGDVDGAGFIAMELVDGRSLSDLIVPGGLPIETVLHYGLQVASALAHAHEHGVVHGDLKGQNVLVTRDGHVKLVDFGLARTLDSAAVDSLTRPGTAAGELTGTLPFMAPETIGGARLGPSADVWSLGVLLHQMATGALPFTGENAYDLAAAIVSRPPKPLPPSVPVPVAAVIARCLTKDPVRRYATARDPFVALEALVPAARDSGTSQARSAAEPAAAAGSPRSRIPRRWALIGVTSVLIVFSVLLGWRWMSGPASTTAPSGGKLSLIVLPFDNLSGNSQEDYFASGMTEALITDLSRIPTLQVISRYSAMRYKALGKSARELSEEVGVQVIVDGTVLRSERQVRVGIRLVDAATDRILLAREYTRELQDVLALQAGVVRAIASEIRAQVVPADEERLKRAAAVAPEAHEEYLRGRHHWNRRTPDGLLQSIVHYDRALAFNPDFALAHAGLAQSYVVLPAFPVGAMSPAEAFPRARKAAERAIALDDRLADAHAALGYANLHAFDFPGAERSFRQALEINPSDATTRFWFAAALASRSRFDEAVDQATQAAALDPVSPIIMAGVAWVHHLARRFELAAKASREALGLEPNFMMARYRLGEAYLHQGRYDEAIEELEKAHALSGGSPDLLAAAAYAYGRAGRRAEALERLRTLDELSKTRFVSPFAIALVHTGLGDADQAFAWLDRAVELQAWGAAFLPVEADFDPLRADPRFKALVVRVRGPGSEM